MRSLKQFFTDITRKPPILFPLVALGHIFWLLLALANCWHEPFPDMVWLEFFWMLGFTTFWIAACDLRKWGANGYILLTLLNVALYLGEKSGKIPGGYRANMLEISGLFSIFILFYYKRFNR